MKNASTCTVNSAIIYFGNLFLLILKDLQIFKSEIPVSYVLIIFIFCDLQKNALVTFSSIVFLRVKIFFCIKIYWGLSVSHCYFQMFTPFAKLNFTSVNVRCEIGNGDVACSCSVGPMESEAVYKSNLTDKSFCDIASNATLLCLEDELKSCQELNDLEPGNKCKFFG